MSIISVLGTIYQYGFVAGFVFCGATRLILSLIDGDLKALPGAVVPAVFGALLWPIAIPAVLSVLQSEYGLFWRPEGWKPESLVVLEILHHEGRELTGLEIQDISNGRVGSRVYSILPTLAAQKLVTRRLETDDELIKRVGPERAQKTPYRRSFWKITDSGRRARFSTRSLTPNPGWDAIPIRA